MAVTASFEGAKLAPDTNAHAQRNQDFELETIATVKTITIFYIMPHQVILNNTCFGSSLVNVSSLKLTNRKAEKISRFLRNLEVNEETRLLEEPITY